MRICTALLVVFCCGLVVGCSVNGFAQQSVPPFSINKRPQPVGSDLENLIPRTIGTFKRNAIEGNTDPFSGEDVNVEYKAGKDTIFFGFAITKTLNDAYEAIEITRKEAIESKIPIKGAQYQIGKNPSYFKNGDFMSWTRGKYFFYAKANNQRTLENFMKAFPY